MTRPAGKRHSRRKAFVPPVQIPPVFMFFEGYAFNVWQSFTSGPRIGSLYSLEAKLIGDTFPYPLLWSGHGETQAEALMNLQAHIKTCPPITAANE
jgi:hypothetical protein